MVGWIAKQSSRGSRQLLAVIWSPNALETIKISALLMSYMFRGLLLAHASASNRLRLAQKLFSPSSVHLHQPAPALDSKRVVFVKRHRPFHSP